MKKTQLFVYIFVLFFSIFIRMQSNHLRSVNSHSRVRSLFIYIVYIPVIVTVAPVQLFNPYINCWFCNCCLFNNSVFVTPEIFHHCSFISYSLFDAWNKNKLTMYLSDVFAHVSIIATPVFAHRTLVWFFTRMSSNVSLKNATTKNEPNYSKSNFFVCIKHNFCSYTYSKFIFVSEFL